MDQLSGSSQLLVRPHKISNRRPKIAAFGEWNTANLGDRAIFEGVRSFCQKAGWEIDAYGLGTLTPVSLATIVDHSIDTDSIQSTTTSRPYSLIGKDGSLNHALYRRAKQTVRGLRQHHRMNRLLPQLRQADAILVGGGSLLSDHQLHFPQSLVEIAQASRKLKLPLLCLGCGALESWSPKGKAMITEFARACTFIAAREQETANRLAAILSTPVPVFGDFALALPAVRRKASQQPVLAINVMQLVDQQGGYQTQYEATLIEIAKRWLQQFPSQQKATIKLFTTGTREDVRPAERVGEQINSQQVLLCRPNSVNHLNQFLHQPTAVLASRLHAAILAISQGTPVIGLGAGLTSLKLDNFFASLGISDYSVSTLNKNAVSRTLEMLNQQALSHQSSHMNLQDLLQTRAEVNTILDRLVLQNS